MNPNIKSLWLEALRSGRYAQTKNYLRTNNGFCCLGVLCDLAEKDGIVAASEPVSSLGVVLYDTEDSLPPTCVEKWACISVFGAVEYNGLEYSLAKLNDEVGLSFCEIADLIEKQL
jgi:hypothetical protein